MDASLASMLGLRAVRVATSTIAGGGFAAMRRATEPPAVDAKTTSTWIAGERDALGVAIGIADVGPAMYTAVRVEIAPPLSAGMRMTSPGLPRFVTPQGPADHHGFGELVVHAHDAPRAHGLLDGRMGGDLVGALGMLKNLGAVAVQDGLVEVFLSDDARIPVALDSAVLAARILSSRAAALAPSAADESLRREWERYAVDHALTIDWPRRRMSAAAIEIAFEPLPLGALTTIRVKFPRVLTAGLHFRRDPRGRFVAKKQPAPDDVQIGDAEFDGQFVIDAVAPDRARAIFAADPTLRALLADLASTSIELVVNDREVFASSSGRLPPADLHARATALEHAAKRIVPERATGPYR
ncbi:MAG TPA: hypothetical protein VIF62_22965 [Labilithrix sp.]